jgi:basic membrane protein A and related proteins
MSILAAALFASSTISAYADNAGNAPLKVGFLLVGPVSDRGFNYAHNRGRLYIEKESHGQIQTTMAESVPENAEAERVLERMVAQGNKLIFTPSYGFLEPALRVAARHPEVIFMQINRLQDAKNMGTYFSHQWQPMYLAGIVAGRMTKTNKLGFVAATPVPALITIINAFELGARSVNPKAQTFVTWINKWSDPPLESEAVKSLVEKGCDVIGHAQDNQNTVLSTAERAGVYTAGIYSDGRELAPKGWLTGACLDWGPYYLKIANSVKDHTWRKSTDSAGMEGGYIKLASFGSAVSKSVQTEVLAKEKLLEEGKLAVFQGPLKDREGKERLAAGQKADTKQLAEMYWFVPGVVGALPKK